MNEELKTLMKIILRGKVGVCHGFYLNRSRKLSCGVGHNVEAHPVARNLMTAWLKRSMTDEEIEVLLDKDIESVHRMIVGIFDWTDFTEVQQFGWHVIAMQIGMGMQIRLYRACEAELHSIELASKLHTTYRELTKVPLDPMICALVCAGVVDNSLYALPELDLNPTFVV